MVARSTTHGTPVKSCITTRAGVNWISVSGSAVGSQAASARTWSAVMFAPSSVRSRFSSRIFSEYGSFWAPVHLVQPVDLVRRAAHLQRVLAAEAVLPDIALTAARHERLLSSSQLT